MNVNPDSRDPDESVLLQRIERDPRDAESLLQLGVLRLQRRDAPGAREVLLRAHVLNPASPVIRIYAALAMCGCRDDRAAQMLVDWRRWLPLPEQQQFDLALAMQHTDWTAEAVDVLQELLSRAPRNPWAKLLLASLYERVNRLEDADSIVGGMLSDAACQDDAVRAELLYQSATLLKRKGHVAKAREILEHAGPRFAGDAEHYFELAELADRQHDVQAAMQYLRDAHALQVQELERVAPQRLRQEASVFPHIAQSLTAEDYATWPAMVSPGKQHSPIFVVGFPRSGTTLVEQMLDVHPRLQSMDERPHLATLAGQLEDYGIRVPTDLAKLTQADCDELRKGYLMLVCSKIQRRWDSMLVDKNPSNLLWLPLIYRLFPEARLVLMLRHPCDVLLSNYMQNYRTAVMMAASASLETLARSCVQAFDYWFHHEALLRPMVLTIRYEDLVSEPETQVARLGEYLELAHPEVMLHAAEHAREKGFIGTPSYTQVIEPINRRGIGRWRRYRRWFGPASEILAPLLPRIGYSLEDDA
jgi:tetratricopeptide (TPR) repeat protein